MRKTLGQRLAERMGTEACFAEGCSNRPVKQTLRHGYPLCLDCSEVYVIAGVCLINYLRK